MKPNKTSNGNRIRSTEQFEQFTPMKTQNLPDPAANGALRPLGNGSEAHLSPSEKGPLLLLSHDEDLYQNLRSAARQAGRRVIQIQAAADAPQTLRDVRPVAVLLDLELPAEAAWATADALLQEENCPPLILLTSRSEQFDFKTTIHAGFLKDKSVSPVRLLEEVDQTLQASGSAQRERNAAQQVVIRWLNPCSWSVRVSPAHRFWGINE